MPVTGIERFDADGTIHYTDTAKALMADIEPGLTEPYNALTDTTRTGMLLDFMNSWKS
jgi:hypothetical protein